MNSVLKVLCLFFLFSLLAPTPAHAYIDPGIGSMLLQGLAAGFITFLVFWRGLVRKISSFFSKEAKETKEKDDDVS